MLSSHQLNSQALFARSEKVTPGGVHSPVRAFINLKQNPIFFEKALGPYLYSIEGRRYVDYCMSFGPLILGHRDPEVSEAVLEISQKLWSLGACEKHSLELAEWIHSHLPFVEKIRFVSSGTEAVMSALRLARAFTHRNKILKFEGCYHGHVDSMLVKAGSGLAGKTESSSQGISTSVVSDTLIAPLDDEKILKGIFDLHGSHIAAVIVEPLPANYGLLPQRKNFVQMIFKLAQKHGSLVIFDEVISGFRVKLGGMAELWDFKPDLVCYGKVLGGGFPVGAFGGKKEILNSISPLGKVYQAGTLSAHPVAMVAGLTTLKKLKRDHVFETLEKRRKKWTEDLQKEIEKKNSFPWKCISLASLFWWTPNNSKTPPRSIKDISPNQSSHFKPWHQNLLKKDVYLSPSPFEVNFLSLSHTEEILYESGYKMIEAFLKR